MEHLKDESFFKEGTSWSVGLLYTSVRENSTFPTTFSSFFFKREEVMLEFWPWFQLKELSIGKDKSGNGL